MIYKGKLPLVVNCIKRKLYVYSMLTTQQHNLLPTPTGALQISGKPLWFGDSGGKHSSPQPLYPVFSLVVPTYNEGSNICAIVQRLSHVLDEALPNAYELIIVDDDSPDHT